MFDATMRALMAVDEIPRANTDWRAETNRPYVYEAITSMRPLGREPRR